MSLSKQRTLYLIFKDTETTFSGFRTQDTFFGVITFEETVGWFHGKSMPCLVQIDKSVLELKANTFSVLKRIYIFLRHKAGCPRLFQTWGHVHLVRLAGCKVVNDHGSLLHVLMQTGSDVTQEFFCSKISHYWDMTLFFFFFSSEMFQFKVCLPVLFVFIPSSVFF